MNQHEVRGAVRHVKGRAEGAVGSLSGDLRRQVEGAYDQVAGGVQHTYGRAVEEAEELLDQGRGLARDARGSSVAYLREADRARGSVVREARRVVGRNPIAAVLGVAAAAFVIGRLSR